MTISSWSLIKEPKLHPIAERYAEHVNPAFVKLLGVYGFGRIFERARGSELWDSDGRRYLDFLAGFGTVSFGHNPPRLVERLARALASDTPNVLHVGPSRSAAELGAELARRVPSLPIALFSLSGGEAVEAAIKLARAATGRPGIVYASGGFHGTGLGGLSVMGHARWQKPFQPLLPECHAVPFGDLDALASVLEKKRVAAFVVEPIQGEAGVVVPPDGYLAEAQALCRKNGALFVLDEVQTGIGRTGSLFAFEDIAELDPDAIVIGKALGAGLIPISATLTRREIHAKAYGTMWKFDLHGSTYSGNSLSCRTALEVLAMLDDEKLAARAAERGTRLKAGLEKRLAGHPFVKNIRGRGLLIGIELGSGGSGTLARLTKSAVDLACRQVLGQWLAVRLLERGFLAQPASQEWNVLKLTPPLNVTETEIDAFVGATGDVLEEYRELAPLLADVTRRLGRQLVNGGEFG
jgi:putrescine aminotransferase